MNWTRVVATFVISILGFAAVTGFSYGFDDVAIGLFFGLVLIGSLAIAVARGQDKGIARPAQCGSCGGLLSPNAPYCKHCGEPIQRI